MTIKALTADTKGFTLVELLIVIAIVAILAAIALPFFNRYLERGNDVELASDANSAFVSAQLWLLDNPSGTVDSKSKLRVGGYSSSPNMIFKEGDMTIISGKVVMVSSAANDARNVATVLFNGRVITSSN